jgi:hypothetical protein
MRGYKLYINNEHPQYKYPHDPMFVFEICVMGPTIHAAKLMLQDQ